MADKQLELIRQYFDTSGMHLSSTDKDLLCTVLEDPSKYDGYESELFTKHNSGRTIDDTWESETTDQYRININTSLSIDNHHRHSADGYVREQDWHITDIKRIVDILRKIL